MDMVQLCNQHVQHVKPTLAPTVALIQCLTIIITGLLILVGGTTKSKSFIKMNFNTQQNDLDISHSHFTLI